MVEHARYDGWQYAFLIGLPLLIFTTLITPLMVCLKLESLYIVQGPSNNRTHVWTFASGRHKKSIMTVVAVPVLFNLK